MCKLQIAFQLFIIKNSGYKKYSVSSHKPCFVYLIFANDKILAYDNVSAFIDAPSPIVVYDKLNAEEAPNLLYVEYYRGGAHDDTLITLDTDNVNYLNCNLEGVVLNPNGAIKYYNHYHDALYEDE